MDALKALVKQPFWIVALAIGGILVALSCASFDKQEHWSAHAPDSYWLLGIGLGLLGLSAGAYGFAQWLNYITRKDLLEGAGLDLTKVREVDGVISTRVGGCEIRIVCGRIEDQRLDAKTAMVLPCNEYFDNLCVEDTGTALGAYVHRNFDGDAGEFAELISKQCVETLGTGTHYQKTDHERAVSFGIGRCLLLQSPLNHSVTVALVSTATQRAGQGLAARISYLFDAMRGLVARLADARLASITMPILGSGKGGIHAPLALVGLLLAVAEAARYSEAGRQLKTVTVVVFQADRNQPAVVDPVVIRRALALIAD